MSLIEDQQQIPRPRQAADDLLARGVQDATIGVASTSQPASIDVQSNLAEDTVIAGVMDIAVGVNKVAMFANPFTDGSEEMLYVDEQQTLRWARHANPSGIGQQPAELAGWSIDPVVSNVVEVVVAVHPRESVFAFVLVGDEGDRHLTSYELIADPAVPGGHRWGNGRVWLPNMNLAGLQVYYGPDRPATPFVFVTDPKEPRLFWYSPTFPPVGSSDLLWRPGGEFRYDPADRGARVLAGVDSAVQIGNTVPVVDCVRLWAVFGGGLYLTTYWPTQQSYERKVVGHGWKSVIGTWTHPHAAGVVGIMAGEVLGGQRIGLALPYETYRSEADTFQVQLDRLLDDLVVWQDAATMLHLYGRDSDRVLDAVHQVDWQTSYNGLTRPVWDQHVNEFQQTVLTTRPLVAQVATFAVDAFPDDLPSQHVMHQGVQPGESCAIYTQSVRTSFWCREQVRLVPETLPKPYVVPRYETSLTVKDGSGNAMVGVPVSLSADSPVDLEVAGAFYRTGAVTPVTLMTDLRGQVTLRVVASGLSVPQLYVTAPGLAQSVTVQMAADVHKFLAGNGTLPNHGDGFTAATVLDATNADGSPLFPNLNRGDGATTWPPSATDVVTWCQAVFAIDAGVPLPPAMSAGLDGAERVHAFTLQTHDPDRPGFQVFTGHEQLEARGAAIAAKGGFLDEADDWVGDVWLGIRQGVTTVAEVLVEVEDRVIELVVELADGILARLRAAWDDIASAAHAVEAVFVAIGAKLQQAIDWLRWAFDFGDALLTAKALADALDQAPRLVKFALDSMERFTDDFFVNLEAQVDTFFETAKQRFQGRSFSALQGPFGTVPSEAQPPATVSSAGDHATGPHASWMTEKVMGPGTEGALRVEGSGVDVDILDEFVKILGQAGELTSLVAVTDDIGQLFGNLFSGKDPESVLTSEIVTVLDLAKDIVTALLTFLDQVANGVIAWGKIAVDQIAAIFAMPLDGSPLISLLWDFVLEQAGVNPADYPLTLGMFGMFFISYPFTVVWKMVAGAPPFPSGRIPMPPLPGGSEGPRANPSADLLRFQAFQGMVQTLDAIADGLIRAEAKVIGDAKAAGVPQPWEIPALFNRVFTAAHVVAYVVGDFPWFWGYPWPGGDAQHNLPYARYGLTFLFNMLDTVVTFTTGKLAQQFQPLPTDPNKEKKELVYVASTTAFGFIRLGLQFWESGLNPQPNWYDHWNLWINQTAYMQTAFGFIRKIYMQFPQPLWFNVLAIESVFAVLGDVFSGLSTIAQPVWELEHPPAIAYGGAPVQTHVFPVAVAGKEYVLSQDDQLEVKGGWPGYDWTTAGDAGNPDFDNPNAGLPDGLALAPGRDYAGWDYKFVTITGAPPTPRGWTAFDLSVQDNYGPALMASVPCFFRVLAADPPKDTPPVASFEVIPPSGPSSTWQLIDTSTGGPATAWAWGATGHDSLGTDPIAGLPDPGTHELIVVGLKVTNAFGSGVANQEISTGMPISDFTMSPASGGGAAPLTVTFTDASRNGPDAWQWDFGDGQTSTEPKPTHTYASPGVYTVTLTAKNMFGRGAPYSQQVTAYGRPLADFYAVPTSGPKPLKVRFTDTSANMPTSWYWVFGDNNQSTSTERNPTFTYYTAGTYTVFLTATNPAGPSTVHADITVTAT